MNQSDFEKILNWYYADVSHNGFEYYSGGQPIGSKDMILSNPMFTKQLEDKLLMNLRVDNKDDLVEITTTIISDVYLIKCTAFNSEKKKMNLECVGSGDTRDIALLNTILDYINYNK